MEQTGLIKNPIIVKLSDGVDHENWLEIGEKDKHGLKMCKVSYEKKFGWLYDYGWIDEKELEKAKQNKPFKFSVLLSGHGIP